VSDNFTELLSQSNLFDEQWYIQTYHDVAYSGLTPLNHYLKYGLNLLRNPSEKFDAQFYLNAYKDVADSGMNPLVHYLNFGIKEGRTPLADAEASPEQKQLKEAHSKLRELRLRFLNLGFKQRALKEFNDIITHSLNPYLKQLALWELAVWYANQYTQEGAKQCLRLLEQLTASEPELSPELKRRKAILAAEALDLLDESEQSQAVLANALEEDTHADLYLAYSRYKDTDEEKISTINKALSLCKLSQVELTNKITDVPYDRLKTKDQAIHHIDDSQARVTIIIPAYNAEKTISTTLDSLLQQTWQNIEIIVSDDCSSDKTVAVVARYLEQDKRIQLIRNERNSGPYVARNRALKIATGDFITINDADDWSHAQKIELQAKHLLENPDIMANTSQQARISENLNFYRRGNPGFYLQFNISSLMFRHEAVLKKIGYWDSVRFAADSEFMRRIQKRFGKKAVQHLETGPLSFQRQTDESLTGSETFGYHGYKMGVRKTYEDNHKLYHRQSKKLFLDYPQKRRVFPLPEPMQPQREVQENQKRKFDIILVSDFRMPGGTSMSNAEEIKANSSLGLRTGLLQMSSYHMNPTRNTNPEIYKLIKEGKAEQIVFGESVSCDLLLIRLPWVLQDWQEYIPEVDAKHIRVIVNQPPKRDYGPNSETMYDLATCSQNLKKYFGKEAIWSPIGPLVRDALTQHHAHELQHIKLSPENWHNIINTQEWQRKQLPEMYTRIKLCRHSRDQYVKWPEDKETLEKIYPVGGTKYSVNILGGAETPLETLGRKLPNNWNVTEFGKEDPKTFLAKHDVFVYYTHTNWIESFGRVIFEAMAVGLPVVLPEIYEPLFKDAALYAKPDDVLSIVDELMANPSYYQAQVNKATQYVEQHFGYAYHEKRINDIVNSSQQSEKTTIPKKTELSQLDIENKENKTEHAKIILNQIYERTPITNSDKQAQEPKSTNQKTTAIQL